MAEYRDSFTTDELMEAVLSAHEAGKAIAHIVDELGLDPSAGKAKVQVAMAKLRKQGVNIPSFRGKGKTPKMDLTPEQVESYNEQLEEAGVTADSEED
jgi:biotin operon repressor